MLRGFQFRRARSARNRQVNESLSDGAAHVNAALRDIQLVTERETLACGEVLGNIVETVRQIGLESDRALASSMERANDVAARFVEGMQRDIVAQESAVREALELTQGIEAAIGAIDGLTRYANMLAINAKIEAVRLGEPGRSFEVIADNMRGFSDVIAEAAQRVSVSIEGVRRGLPPISEHAASMHERTRVFTEEVAVQVRSASLKNTEGRTGADGLNEVIELSNRALSHLQFQDPVSQKLCSIQRRLEGPLCDSPEDPEKISDSSRPAAGEMVLF